MSEDNGTAGKKSGALVSAAAILLLAAACQGPGQTTTAVEFEPEISPKKAVEFEPEVSLKSAADILPAALLSGRYHQVRDEVVARGFVHYYVIESRYGEFPASGDSEVRKLVREINAIAELRRLSKSQVITESATDAAKRGYVAAKAVIDKPMETAKGIPSGVARLFKRSKRQAEDAYDKVSEWYRDEDKAPVDGNTDKPQTSGITTKKVRKAADLGIDEGQDYLKGSLGFNRERRRLARALGIDPYTRNARLRQELASMAWTATAGSFAANLILPDVPTPIGLLKDTQELVWNMKAIDLRLRNEDMVRRMDIGSARREAFFENETYTLSDQTRLVQALTRLDGVEKRARLLEEATRAQSREESRFYVRTAELLALYHEQRTALTKLIGGEHGPLAARDEDDRLIIALPLDYLNWSRSAHDTAEAMQKTLSQRNRSASEVWVEGIISDRAHQELHRLGWMVQARAFERLAGH